MNDIEKQIKKRDREMKIILILLFITFTALLVTVSLGEDQLAKDAGHLVKVYHQAQK